MKRVILSLTTFTSSIAFAGYAIIIDKKTASYETGWTNWTDKGDYYDCQNPRPLASEIDRGTSFTQTLDCKQDQERTSQSGFNESRTISKTVTENKIGSFIYKTCMDWLERGHTTDGNYDIDPSGLNEFSAYCDMTTNGGGWTLVFYSNSSSVSRSSLDDEDWNVGNAINFSLLHSFKDIKDENGKYEFFVHDSSDVFRHAFFTQTNAYNQSPFGNDFQLTGGNLTFTSQTNGSRWFGLALGSFGQSDMASHCSLSMADYGATWTFCIQDQYSQNYNTGPWYYNSATGGYDAGSQRWVKIYQR
jgi:hypothetical protein